MTVPQSRPPDIADGAPSARAEAYTPRFLSQQLLGVARLAAFTLDRDGRVLHWNAAATDLFGVPPDDATGRDPAALLRLPSEHRAAFRPGAFGHVWCGACTVPRADHGELVETAWWVYPIDDAPGIGVLALAADLRHLREEGPGLSMGGVLVAGPDGAARRDSGARLLRVEPALADGAAAPVAGALAGLLPPADPATSIITRRVLDLGCPAVSLSLTIRLPVVPYRGGPPYAPHVRPLAADTTARPDAPVRPGADTDAVREHLAFLGEAGQQIGSSLDHLQAARTLAEVLVPRLADFAAVELLESVVADSAPHFDRIDETTPMRRVAVVHDEPGRWDGVVPEDAPLLFPSSAPFVQAMRAGNPVHIPHVGPERAAELADLCGGPHLRPLFAGRAFLVVPLIARGCVLGTFKLLRKPDRPGFDDLDLALLGELARRTALCIDNGRLYRREVQTAQELQRSMLPDDPPDVAGARVRYRYRPAGQAAQVGGDWFDAIPLPGCRLGIVVGDVMGHGLTSAAIMGQLRTAVRTLAGEDTRPGRLLRQLDGLARRLGDGYLATCLYAIYDPVSRTCTLANAGHVPPVLVAPDGTGRVLDLPEGVPIGVGGAPFDTVQIPVEDGSRLVLCTDGLLERRDRDLDQGLRELCAHLAAAPPDLDAACDAVLAGLGSADPADDIALVAVGFDGVPADDVAAWDLAPEPSMVRWARAQVAERLTKWDLDALTPTIQLLASELATNALLHGAGSIRLRLVRGRALVCEVYDDGADLPQLRTAAATDESGRGLQLVSNLAARWGTHRTTAGKVVWFEHDL
ncbi:SpoIIE family protein phosphatase [Actinomadura algeriensis]|uniref:Serine phosphatase RsbU (Regulator of sigma subunit)/anti-sigma regulatory factor (Ser/Thr protein kinase) n=1 Tax=Actinomadura algeriensis TaxID=1679523 RepID=A0ABR9JU09_9ACTN|nr:SpoIIE family protein phosphatase [Actinomadura algeriensis]MBE1533851.1 serine phosphatase RsbU (regulator of sigma subunit)/anti-sigma regulatory factor (Ser/Thr protein kinase) [Actinomadura algeriensis]